MIGHARRQGEGLLRAGREPGRRLGATRSCTGSRWRELDWLVVRDFAEIESAVVLARRARRSRRGELRTEDIATEVFFLPAAAHTEKDGTFTNTQRLLQWHHKAVEPPGDCRSRAVVHATTSAAGSGRSSPARPSQRDRPLLDLTWDYPTDGPHDGARRRGGAARDQRLRRRTASRCRGYTELRADGSTACGCWIYCGCYADGVNQTGAPQARPRAELGRARVGLGVAGEPAHPLQPRLGRPRRAARGRSASATSGGTTEHGRWTGRRRARLHAPTCRPTTSRREGATRPRTRSRGDEPFIMQADGRGWLFAPERARRRPAADALRAARVAVREPALRPAARTRRAQLFDAAATTRTTRRRTTGATFPVRHDHLPADRAPHRRRRCRARCPTSPSCSRRCSAR